jgi:HAE1 family hydrophobic/amphiphilic exporter-1
MGFIKYAVENPVKVTSGVILIVMFGFLSFFIIPVQLTPDVDQPIITVTTRWPGASPQEVENEIVDRQEEKLKSITDLRKMTSSAQRGEATVTLEFNVGADKDNALRDAIEKINQVGSYPEEVDRPEVVASDAALESPIAWLIFRDNTGADVSTLRDFVDDEVKPILERAKGVAHVDIYGGREREVQVLVDPAKMAARRITFRELEDALRGQNVNRSAGTTALGKREYTYRQRQRRARHDRGLSVGWARIRSRCRRSQGHARKAVLVRAQQGQGRARPACAPRDGGQRHRHDARTQAEDRHCQP